MHENMVMTSQKLVQTVSGRSPHEGIRFEVVPRMDTPLVPSR